MDPLANRFPSLSAYVYALNNPALYVDPNGMAPQVGEGGPLKWILKQAIKFVAKKMAKQAGDAHDDELGERPIGKKGEDKDLDGVDDSRDYIDNTGSEKDMQSRRDAKEKTDEDYAKKKDEYTKRLLEAVEKEKDKQWEQELKRQFEAERKKKEEAEAERKKKEEAEDKEKKNNI